ncbi:MAG: hypothetical protein Fur0010_11770 [Bdellovibrio sp.]
MKVELRKQLKALLADLTIEERAKKNLKLNQHLIEFLHKNNISHKTNIGVFYPLDDEPNCLMAFNEFEALLSWPVFDDAGEMYFATCDVNALVEKKAFGKSFKIPPLDAKSVTPALILVPGLGFSRDGERLGRGKGYYDRYLSQFNGLKIGICFEEMLLKKIPSESHDVKVDFVVSDQGILKTTSN